MATPHPQWLLAIMILLGLVPMLVMCSTCYLKVSVVINLLKGGLGFTSGGTMAIEFALSIALVALIMHPIAADSAKQLESLPPLPIERAPKWSDVAAIEPVFGPWRTFLEKHAGAREVAAMRELIKGSRDGAVPAHADSPLEEANDESVKMPLRVLFAAFILSELRGAIVIGVMVLIPFLLLDLIIANSLTALGLTMVSPVSISLPLKLLLFYGCDGWILISRTLFLSY